MWSLARWRAILGQSVDGSSLAVFRIAFGLLLAYEVFTKLGFEKHIELYAPELHFKYLFFEWVPSPESYGASVALHWVLITLALCVAAGLAFRLSAWLLFLLFSAYFLMERTLYINHLYLYCLLSGLLAFSQAHNMLSVDAWLARGPFKPLHRGATRVVDLYLLRFQMGVVYFFAGVAKLNGDWLQGSPLNIWLDKKAPYSPFCDLLKNEQLPLLMSWGGVAFDLLVVPLLLWKRTRWIGFGWALAFHATNASIFGIASFPWMSLALSTLFFEPDWPRRVLAFVQRRTGKLKALDSLAGTQLSSLGASLLPRWAVVLAAGYCAVQLLLPLRHWLYPNDVAWTEDGHLFSWRMMLRTKKGDVEFEIRDPETGKRQKLEPLDYLTRRQTQLLALHPDLMHQLALHVADERVQQGKPRPQVFVRSRLSLNGRRKQRFVQGKVDLAAQPRGLGPTSWLRPLKDGPPRPPKRKACPANVPLPARN